MTTVSLTLEEINVLLKLTKPTTYKRLYPKLNEIADIDSKLNNYLSSKNYTMLDDSYAKKNIIKSTIIINQLKLLKIYQVLIKSKNKPNNYVEISVPDNLMPLLVETIILAIKRSSSSGSENENIYLNKTLSAILTKLEENITGYSLYAANKKLKSMKNIIDFNDYVKDGK